MTFVKFVITAFRALRARSGLLYSVPVHGRNVFCSDDANTPSWLAELTPGELLVEMQRRIEYLVPRYNQRYILTSNLVTRVPVDKYYNQ